MHFVMMQMVRSARLAIWVALLFLLMSADPLMAQPPGGRGGPPGQSGDRELVSQFDADGDGMLGREERKAAREWLKENPVPSRGPRGFGRGREPGTPGPQVEPADVAVFPDASLYERTVLRTFFLEFENDDWEQELAEFKPTDVEVPATLTVDGKDFPNVGVSFRGASSFFMIPEGLKRSLNLSMDLADGDQRLYGYKSLNLLNCNGDASMMSAALFSDIVAARLPVTKVNFVKVVINGESWGVYANAQQFNTDFLREHYDTDKGARWKVPGSPRGDGGLRYLGESLEPYRDRFEIKSKDKESSWRDLIELCRLLDETPAEEIPEALEGHLDLDGVLWFLAADIALVNSDGYWTRASDYNLYQDPDGKFHVLQHDMNEAFRSGRGGAARGARRGPPPGGPPESGRGGGRRGGQPQAQGGRGSGRGRGGFGGGGVTLDPLTGLEDPSKPLRSKLLANDELRTRYLQHLRTIAQDLLDWEFLGPRVRQIRELLEEEVAADTRKLASVEDFKAATSDEPPTEQSTSLRAFAEKRRAYLLNHEAIRALPDDPN